MTVTVTTSGGSTHTFERVMGFRTDGETFALRIEFSDENAGVHARSFSSGEWVKAEVQP